MLSLYRWSFARTRPCAGRGIRVQGYDIFAPLVDFWQCLLAEPIELADRVDSYYPLEKERFYSLQKTYLDIQSPLERAAVFYVLNRASFSGVTLSGGMSSGHPRFTISSIDRLRDFAINNFTVEQADFQESIACNPQSFLYLDPPYLNGQKLYGVKGDTHEGFDHRVLRDLLENREGWILSYNDCPAIRELYKGYRIINLNWQYGMGNSKVSNEVIVVSPDLELEL